MGKKKAVPTGTLAVKAKVVKGKSVGKSTSKKSQSVTTSVVAVAKEKISYTKEELKEFEALIVSRLSEQKGLLAGARKTLLDVDSPKGMLGEPEAEVRLDAERVADRAGKMVVSLEAALVRVKSGTYGTCRITGKLIPKERLRLVPHATTTVAGKQVDSTPGFSKKYNDAIV